MDGGTKNMALDKTVELTKAAIGNGNSSTGAFVDANGGKDVAEFMQAVFDKVVQLYSA